MRTKFAIFMLIVLLICVVSCDSEKITSGSSETPVENPTETPTQPSEPTAKAIGTLAELEDAVKTEGDYYLTADLTIVGYLNVTAPITLDGRDKTINVDYQTVACTKCNGNLTVTQTCSICNGSGSKTCHLCNGIGGYNGPNNQFIYCSTTEACPTTETVTCSTCNGTGKMPLDEADTGLVIKSEGVTLKNVKFVSKTAGGRNHAQVIINANGTPEKPIIIDACSFDSDKTLDKTFQESAIIGNYGGGAYLTVKNCTIKNMKYGMYFNQISNAEISGNTIDGTKYNGINIAADSEDYPCTNIAVENNTLINISYANYSEVDYSCGIRLGKKCSGITLSNNNITMLNDKTPIVESYLN
jgi:hypothetical protein